MTERDDFIVPELLQVKVCGVCRLEKPTTEFSPMKGKCRKEGATQSYCKLCRAEYGRKRYATDPEYRKRYKLASNSWRQRNWERHWAKSILSHIRTRDLLTNLDIDYLIGLIRISTHCPDCGVKLIYPYTTGTSRPLDDNTPTVDAIEAGLKHVKGNVRIVCYPCNAGKNHSVLEDYYERCRRVAQLHPQQLERSESQ